MDRVLLLFVGLGFRFPDLSIHSCVYPHEIVLQVSAWPKGTNVGHLEPERLGRAELPGGEGSCQRTREIPDRTRAAFAIVRVEDLGHAELAFQCQNANPDWPLDRVA